MIKNVLFFHQSADLYGSDRVLLSVLKSFDQNKYKAIVLIPKDGPLVNEFIDNNIEYHVLPLCCLSRSILTFPGILRLPFHLIKSLFLINKIVGDRPVDFVYSNTLVVLSGAVWSFLKKTPHFWHVHEILIAPKFVRYIYSILLSLFADKIICVSNSVRSNLIEIKPSLDHKIVVIWNGVVRTQKFNNFAAEKYRQTLGLYPRDVLIVLVGRVNRLKGQKLLVEAATKLFQVRSNIKFLMVGSPVFGQEHYLTSLIALADQSPAKANIRIEPFNNNIWTIWDACDIAVIPSIEPESFGLVAIEAMASKKPVIASNHGGLSEVVVSGESGILINPGDVDSLVNALKFLVDNRQARIEMGMTGYLRYLNEFSSNVFSQKIHSLFESY